MSHIATRKQFARNLFSGWISLVIEVLIAFLLTPFIIGKLGAAAYGIWSLMIGLIGYLGLIDIGIRGSVGRYINHYLALKDQRAVSEVVSTSTALLTFLSLISGLISLVIAANFSSIFPKTPPELLGDIRFALPLLAVGLWLSFVSSILGNLLAAKEAMYVTNGFGLIMLLLRSTAVYLVLDAGQGISALVLVTLGTSVISILLTYWSVRRVYADEMPSFFAVNFARLKEMWRFGLASFVARTASTMANDSAPIIGMWILGPEAVAVYSVALTLTQNARRVLDQANGAIFPSVMKAGAIKDFPGLRNLYMRFMDISFAIGSLVFIGLMVFSGTFLHLWVGTNSSGAIVVGILAFGYLMSNISSTGPLSLASLDKIGITVRISLGEAIACIILTAALPGLFGLGVAGMALGTTLPRLFSNCVLYPWLSVESLGNELKSPLVRGISKNLLMAAGLFVGFWCIHLLLAIPESWLTFSLAVSLATLLHLTLIASQYENLPLIGPIIDRFRRLWPSSRKVDR
jgi:O-antigen/teichoic acid export membrane protein